MGVMSRLETSGWIMDPPALSEYAVEPVGVLIIMPSETESVRKRLLMWIEVCRRCGDAPRWRMISLRAWIEGEEVGVRLGMRVPVGEKSPTFRRLRRRTRAPVGLGEFSRFPRSFVAAGALEL